MSPSCGTRAPVQSLAELRSKELVVGATTPGTTMADFPLVVNDILGLKFKVVRGYEGTPQINHAIERGEIQGQGGIGWAAVKAQVPHWIAEKKIKVIAQYGLKRYPELADVPSMLELAANRARPQALTMLFARTEYGRPYFLPPDVPAERVTALRRAFDATMRDPAFVADAARLQLEIDPMTGEEVQALVAQLTARHQRSSPACARRSKRRWRASATFFTSPQAGRGRRALRFVKNYSSRMPALSLITFDQRAVSLRMKASNSAGVLLTGNSPAFCSRSSMVGSAKMRATSACSLSTTVPGVPAGASSPIQVALSSISGSSAAADRLGRLGQQRQRPV